MRGYRAAVVAVALTVALSGCTGGLDAFGGEATTTTATPTDPTQRDIEQAVSLLETNENHFVVSANVSANRSITVGSSAIVSDRFNRTAMVGRAQLADALLVNATAGANASQRETIRNLRRVSDAHVDLAYAIDDTQAALDSAQRARATDPQENATAALATLRRTERHLDSALANVSAARATLNATDAEAVRPYNPARVRFAREHLGPIESNLTTMRDVVESYRSVAAVYVHVDAGRAAMEAGNYTSAVNEMRAANESLYEARTNIERVDDDRLDSRLRSVESNFTTFANATAGLHAMATGLDRLAAANESADDGNHSAAATSFSAAADDFERAHDHFEGVDAAAVPTYNESQIARLRNRTKSLAQTSRLLATTARLNDDE